MSNDELSLDDDLDFLIRLRLLRHRPPLLRGKLRFQFGYAGDEGGGRGLGPTQM